jgi:hypothetical protein
MKKEDTAPLVSTDVLNNTIVKKAQKSIKPPKLVFVYVLDQPSTEALTRSICLTIPTECSRQGFVWKTRNNWGVLLRIFGHPYPPTKLNGMILQIKWKSIIGNVLSAARGFEEFAMPIDVGEASKIKQFLQKQLSAESSDVLKRLNTEATERTKKRRSKARIKIAEPPTKVPANEESAIADPPKQP